MDEESFDRSLRALAKRVPFQSFIVELMNGESFTVEHSEALVFRGGIACYISPKKEMSIFDHQGVTRFIAASSSSKAS